MVEMGLVLSLGGGLGCGLGSGLVVFFGSCFLLWLGGWLVGEAKMELVAWDLFYVRTLFLVLEKASWFKK